MRTYSSIEKKYFNSGIQLIAGIDEAGRGPLAGPVVAAAVVFPKDVVISGVDDSKKLSPEDRSVLFNEIIIKCLSYSVAIINNNEIDKINILNATLKAMSQAAKKLKTKPDLFLIDGNKTPAILENSIAIIGGDEKCFSIAAASIIAKVHRDEIMIKYADEYKEYHFEKNKGYATKKHIEYIKKYGITPIHRKTFLGKILDNGRQEEFQF